MKDRKTMLTARHTYSDPAKKRCFNGCLSCFRCANKGMKTECDSCSGRPDPAGQRIPCRDDFCDCRNGVMRWLTKEGRLVVRKYMSNPFMGTVQTDAKTKDEEDWNSYLAEKREKLNDPEWNPIVTTED